MIQHMFKYIFKYYNTHVLNFIFSYVSCYAMYTRWETRIKQFGAVWINFPTSKGYVHIYTFVPWVSTIFTNLVRYHTKSVIINV